MTINAIIGQQFKLVLVTQRAFIVELRPGGPASE
jgi:hypothetical protein